MIETLREIKLNVRIGWESLAGYRSLKYKNSENQLISQIRCKKALSTPTIDSIDAFPEQTGIPKLVKGSSKPR